MRHRPRLGAAQRASAGADLSVQWEDATVRSRADLTHDAGVTAYDVELKVQSWCDGEPSAQRRWTRSIALDLG